MGHFGISRAPEQRHGTIPASPMSMPAVQPAFELEKQLVAALRDGSARALNLSSGWLQVWPEVTVRQCIADLVLVHAATQPDLRPTRVSYFEAAIIAFLLDRGPCDISTMSDVLLASTASIEVRAQRLARLGLVQIDGDGIRAVDLLPSGVRIVAIEAKLTRWRVAVAQAASYRTFANQSYIAMPAELFGRQPAIELECRRANVGALAVRADGQIDLFVEAPDFVPHSPERVRVLSSLVGVAQRSNVFRQVD